MDAVILRRLRAAGGFIAPSELGPPSAVAERIAALNAAGYEIEHHPHLGYRLLSGPDRLIADDILSRLPECRWIRQVLVFERTGSTNDIVTGLARDGAAAGVAVFAEEQTAGRGRLGRRWQSDPSLGLWFSLLLRPEMPLAAWPRLTLWIAYAIAHGIAQFASESSPEKAAPPVMLKWPNDLHLSGRKLAGILVETSLGERPFATAGIGLNVNHPAFPPPLDATATSLRIETGSPVDRNALAAAILASIDESYSLVTSDFQQIVDWANRVDCLRGRQVSAAAGSVHREGIACGLSPDGGLLLRAPDGAVAILTSGEITHFSQGLPAMGSGNSHGRPG
jgi:BirA family biotin operon repressor/biotin-[acetyl-CoA-carboxylase] ligase